MELEPISDLSQRNWGFHTVRGGDDPRKVGFILRFVQLLERYNGLGTRDGTLSSPGGAGSIVYDLQPIRDRPVGGVGDFHTVRGGINPSALSVFVPGSSELYM